MTDVLLQFAGMQRQEVRKACIIAVSAPCSPDKYAELHEIVIFHRQCNARLVFCHLKAPNHLMFQAPPFQTIFVL